jgi:hypothetical protein
MVRQLRAYSYDSYDVNLPIDVLHTLKAPSWVRQGYLVIFARTAKQANEICVDLGLVFSGGHLPKLSLGGNAEALTDAGVAEEGSVFAFPLQGSEVARIHFDGPDAGAKRTSTLVGHLIRMRGQYVFVQRYTDVIVWVMTRDETFVPSPVVSWVAIGDEAINRMKVFATDTLVTRANADSVSDFVPLRLVVDGDDIDLGPLQQIIVDHGNTVKVVLERVQRLSDDARL